MKYLSLLLIICISGCSMFQSKGSPDDRTPFVCDSSAYVEKKDFELPNLTSASQKAYDSWVNGMASKYPILLNSYVTLFECVSRYHPEVIQPPVEEEELPSRKP